MLEYHIPLQADDALDSKWSLKNQRRILKSLSRVLWKWFLNFALFRSNIHRSKELAPPKETLKWTYVFSLQQYYIIQYYYFVDLEPLSQLIYKMVVWRNTTFIPIFKIIRGDNLNDKWASIINLVVLLFSFPYHFLIF